MDLLDNIATELGFEFHLYVVRDQLFGSRQQRDVKDFIKSKSSQQQQQQRHSSSDGGSGGSSTSNKPTMSSDHDVDDETSNSK